LGQKIILSNIIMLQKTIEVHGLSFIQVDIFGHYLPFITSIEYVLSKYKDKRNKRTFCDASNFVVSNIIEMYSLPSEPFDRAKYEVWFKNIDWDNISMPDVNTSIIKITESQCKLVGCSFYRVLQSMIIIQWFGLLLSSSVSDRRELCRVMTAALRIFRDENATNSDEKFAIQKTRLKPIYPNPMLVKCHDYTEASNCLQEFESRRIAWEKQLCINTGRANFIKSSMIMKADLIHEFELQNISYKPVKKHEDKKIIFSCQRCHVQSLVKQMPKSKICGSCQNKRRRERKESRKIDPCGWESDRIGRCKGGCGSAKIKINTSGSCLKCYRRNL
jgi:hypothetical protein